MKSGYRFAVAMGFSLLFIIKPNYESDLCPHCVKFICNLGCYSDLQFACHTLKTF